MAENQPLTLADSIQAARERLNAELRAQAEHILKLNQDLSELQILHGRTEQEAARQWDELSIAATAAAEAASAASVAAAAEAAAAATSAANAAVASEPKISPDAALENVLTAVRGLTSCTAPEQLFESVTEEAAHWGVRAAIFDVRGKAAWGASAHGFGPALTDRVMRSLIVQINQSTPFRQVVETAGPVDASAESLKKNRNLLDKLKPVPQAPILLLPIRSAGSVSAIFYTDPGGSGQPLPVNSLKILAEFAGAQIDRLIALSGGSAEESVEEPETAEPEAVVEESVAEAAAPEPLAPSAVALEPVPEPAPMEVAPEAPPPTEVPTESAPAEVHAEQHVPDQGPSVVEAPPVEPPTESSSMPEPIAETKSVEAPGEAEAEHPPAATPEAAAGSEASSAPPAVESAVVEPAPEAAPEAPQPLSPAVESAPPPAPAAFDMSQLSESDQKVHKDAKRFARILVSEIELYNKTKVVEGRKNGDLYKRLKSDVDRSRQTYDKRFGKVLSKDFDYFHDELVKTLAQNDAALLGPDYPDPRRETPSQNDSSDVVLLGCLHDDSTARARR